jgi:hypothetical protein
MWARLDDELMDHEKVFAAGELIGKNGPAIALGVYAVGLMWSNKHLTDGYIPVSILKSFAHVSKPIDVADALVSAGLWERDKGGFRIHGFSDFGNPMASEIKAKRRKDRLRKARERADSNGHLP